MINNRQNGRRRGRGGARPSNNAPSPGNRQDNRSRGNAVQLHEKYKALARDAQLAGDRVQTEYYLQFADHYFRVLSEGRARFEEQRRSRDDFANDEDEDQDEILAGDEGEGEDQDEREAAPAPRRERAERQPRGEREARGDREPKFDREPRADREQRADREPRADNDEGRELRPRRQRRRRDEEGEAVADADAGQGGEERIALESLPPAISVIDGGAEEAPRAPRRRTRRPRTEEGEAEIAPAA